MILNELTWLFLEIVGGTWSIGTPKRGLDQVIHVRHLAWASSLIRQKKNYSKLIQSIVLINTTVLKTTTGFQAQKIDVFWISKMTTILL